MCLGLALALGGAAPFGRLALSLGLTGPAGLIFDDPAWRATAAARAGNHDAAATLFAAVPGADYNTGVARARAGRYAAALEAFDRAIAADPDDGQAASNFDLISRVYAGTAISQDAAFALVERDRDGPKAKAPTGLGTVRAAGTGDEATNTGTSLSMAELESRKRQATRKQFDDRFMLANERWLRTLADVPGDYLAARIYEERKRRIAAGLSPPAPEDPR
ncbi:MAG: hypothetical protein CML68_18585 [Rhodobacteraceae bacterium]|nr:hypothetical protein [Paracoccaceae bacterium]